MFYNGNGFGVNFGYVVIHLSGVCCCYKGVARRVVMISHQIKK